METQSLTKIAPEVVAAFKEQARRMADKGASINEVMSMADGFRQTFLDIYTKESIRKIKV